MPNTPHIARYFWHWENAIARNDQERHEEAKRAMLNDLAEHIERERTERLKLEDNVKALRIQLRSLAVFTGYPVHDSVITDKEQHE